MEASMFQTEEQLEKARVIAEAKMAEN